MRGVMAKTALGRAILRKTNKKEGEQFTLARQPVAQKITQLKSHAQKNSFTAEINSLENKLTQADNAATKTFKFDEATRLLGEISNEADAALALANKCASAKQKYASWGQTPLNALNSHASKGQATAEINTLTQRLAAVNTQIQNRQYDAAETALGDLYWDCTNLKKSLDEYQPYLTARATAEQKVNALKTHKQKDALKDEIKVVEDKLTEAANFATAKKFLQARGVVEQIPPLCAQATQLGDRLTITAVRKPELLKKLKAKGLNDQDAERVATYAHKILADENCDDDQAVAMAETANTLVGEGFDVPRALVCAQVKNALLEDGTDPTQANEITHLMKVGGTATAKDAKVVAKGMKIFPTKMLQAMRANGTQMIACQGSITNYKADLKGVVPRGWDPSMTWDTVPGVHRGGDKEVVVGTMDGGGGDRKVPGKGEGPVKHGAFNLIGHEGGHAFDTDGSPAKNTTPGYRTARQKDITDGKMTGKDATPPGKDDYFLQEGNAGLEETFAECCARHFGNDGTFATAWPALRTYFASDPFGVA